MRGDVPGLLEGLGLIVVQEEPALQDIPEAPAALEVGKQALAAGLVGEDDHARDPCDREAGEAEQADEKELKGNQLIHDDSV